MRYYEPDINKLRKTGVAEVAEGVKYYKFAGRDALSKSRQVVHVTEVDLGEASLMSLEITWVLLSLMVLF